MSMFFNPADALRQGNSDRPSSGSAEAKDGRMPADSRPRTFRLSSLQPFIFFQEIYQQLHGIFHVIHVNRSYRCVHISLRDADSSREHAATAHSRRPRVSAASCHNFPLERNVMLFRCLNQRAGRRIFRYRTYRC